MFYYFVDKENKKVIGGAFKTEPPKYENPHIILVTYPESLNINLLKVNDDLKIIERPTTEWSKEELLQALKSAFNQSPENNITNNNTHTYMQDLLEATWRLMLYYPIDQIKERLIYYKNFIGTYDRYYQDIENSTGVEYKCHLLKYYFCDGCGCIIKDAADYASHNCPTTYNIIVDLSDKMDVSERLLNNYSIRLLNIEDALGANIAEDIEHFRSFLSMIPKIISLEVALKDMKDAESIQEGILQNLIDNFNNAVTKIEALEAYKQDATSRYLDILSNNMRLEQRLTEMMDAYNHAIDANELTRQEMLQLRQEFNQYKNTHP